MQLSLTISTSDVVSVITADGRVIVVSLSSLVTNAFQLHHTTSLPQGTLKGFDQTVNVILSGSHERVYSTGAGVEQVQLGLYVIRGDNM